MRQLYISVNSSADTMRTRNSNELREENMVRAFGLAVVERRYLMFRRDVTSETDECALCGRVIQLVIFNVAPPADGSRTETLAYIELRSTGGMARTMRVWFVF